MAANKRKLLTMILLGAAVVAILLLAAGLAQMQFAPGEPFSLARAQQFTPPPMGVSAELSPALRLLLRVWFILTLALLPFSVFYLLLSPEARKRIIPNLIVFAVFMLIMSSLGKQVGQMLGENGVLGGLGDMTGLIEGGASVQPAEFSSSAPSWLVIAISFVVAVIVVALGGSLIYALLRGRNRRRSEEALPLVRIAEEAESALTAIAAGGDLRDTVIRCYVEMGRTVRAARGLQRKQEMTAREFEAELARAGLPGDSVRELTGIFEAVRYGAKDLGPEEERRAVACLDAIAGACRGR